MNFTVMDRITNRHRTDIMAQTELICGRSHRIHTRFFVVRFFVGRAENLCAGFEQRAG